MNVKPNADLQFRILSLAADRKANFGAWLEAGQAVKDFPEFGADDICDAIEDLEAKGMLEPKKRRGRPLDFDGNAWEISVKGMKALKKMKTSSQFNFRLPAALEREIHEYATRYRTTTSAAAVRLLDEGLRMDRFPGIDYRWSPSGRQPYITGTGLSVWEVLMIWVDHGRDTKRVLKNYPSLSARTIETAVEYSRSHGEERPAGGPGEKPPFAKRVEV